MAWFMSHPTGVRGLKSVEFPQGAADGGSHPTGVRGLKLFGFGEPYRRYLVAPHWGAWIEIELDVDLDGLPLVAPHWGAWIEIESVMAPAKGVLVAPHWGAWIEI